MDYRKFFLSLENFGLKCDFCVVVLLNYLSAVN